MGRFIQPPPLLPIQSAEYVPILFFCQAKTPGCILLPGADAPECVVFDGLREKNWGRIHDRVGRQFADVADACSQVMSMTDHHEWVRAAASRLTLSGDHLWQAMSAEWARLCFSGTE